MLCKGDSVGVFQVESRAQMNMLPRLRPREFYDLVVEVAIVRPGPIQGDMVHPYLKARKAQREGKAQLALPGPSPEHGPPDELSSILGRTYGVPIFQEQAMKIALDAAQVQPRRGQQAAQGDGHLPQPRDGPRARGADGRADGRARLRSRIRRALLQPDQGLRRIRLSRKPRGELRAPGLCLELAEVPLPGRLRRRAAQLAADGLLRPGADRPRCGGAWSHGAAGGCESFGVGLHAGGRARGRRSPPRACARSMACPSTSPRNWSPRGRRAGLIAMSPSCATGRGCRPRTSSASPRPTASPRCRCAGVRRCGMRAPCWERPSCRCSPPRVSATRGPSGRSRSCR